MPLLRHASDARTLAFVAAFFGLVALQWMVALPVAVAVPVWLATLTLAFAATVINHDVCHRPVFRAKPLNRALHVALTCIYGLPVSIFVPVHNLSHHKHAQTARDVTRTTKMRSRWHLWNVLRYPTRISAETLRADLRYFREQHRRGRPIVRQLALEIGALVAFDVALLLIDWRAFLLFVFIPQQFGQFMIVTMNYLQHDGCDDDQAGYDHSRNFTGRLFNRLLFNNGYHTIHHNKPGLHWSDLPDAHAREIAPHIHGALEQPSFPRFLWRFLVMPGRRVRYDGAPYQLPPQVPDEPFVYATAETYSKA